MTPELVRILGLFRFLWKTDARCGRLPAPSKQPERLVEGLIRPSPWHLDALLLSVALERMTVERLILALVHLFSSGRGLCNARGLRISGSITRRSKPSRTASESDSPVGFIIAASLDPG